MVRAGIPQMQVHREATVEMTTFVEMIQRGWHGPCVELTCINAKWLELCNTSVRMISVCHVLYFFALAACSVLWGEKSNQLAGECMSSFYPLLMMCT